MFRVTSFPLNFPKNDKSSPKCKKIVKRRLNSLPEQSNRKATFDDNIVLQLSYIVATFKDTIVLQIRYNVTQLH